jgi:hypothetical protein
MEQFEIIAPGDLAALVALTTPEVIASTRTALASIGFKVHAVENHEDFEIRYNQVNYHIVVIEDIFAFSSFSKENLSLRFIQNLPMIQRRHAVFFLIGSRMESLNAMQAFALSVHCVVNYKELAMLPDIFKKTLADNDLFLAAFRDVQRRTFHKPA